MKALVMDASKLHLKQVEEICLQHFRAAFAIALRLAGASLACIVHALVPGLCTKTASRSVAKLNRTLSERSAAHCRPRRDTDIV